MEMKDKLDIVGLEKKPAYWDNRYNGRYREDDARKYEVKRKRT